MRILEFRLNLKWPEEVEKSSDCETNVITQILKPLSVNIQLDSVIQNFCGQANLYVSRL